LLVVAEEELGSYRGRAKARDDRQPGVQIELAECMVRRVNARERLRMKESLRHTRSTAWQPGAKLLSTTHRRGSRTKPRLAPVCLTRATPEKQLTARPPGTASNCLGRTIPPPGQRLRMTLANPRRLSLLRVRVPHAQQNLQNAQLKSLTVSRHDDLQASYTQVLLAKTICWLERPDYLADLHSIPPTFPSIQFRVLARE
jgi:hypothetical protein